MVFYDSLKTTILKWIIKNSKYGTIFGNMRFFWVFPRENDRNIYG
jgi:hypothetical protein